MSDVQTLSPARVRMDRARRAFADSFLDQQTKSAHYRELARKSHAGRLVLRAEDARALARAYELLRAVAAKLPDVPAETSDPGR